MWDSLTLIGKVWWLLSEDLPRSHPGERWQVEPVACRAVWQAEGELCHIRKESLQLGTAHPGAIDYTNNHTQSQENEKKIMAFPLLSPFTDCLPSNLSSKAILKLCRFVSMCVYQDSSSPVWYFNWYPIRMPLGSRGLSHLRWIMSKFLGVIVNNLGTSGTTRHTHTHTNQREERRGRGLWQRRRETCFAQAEAFKCSTNDGQ